MMIYQLKYLFFPIPLPVYVSNYFLFFHSISIYLFIVAMPVSVLNFLLQCFTIELISVHLYGILSSFCTSLLLLSLYMSDFLSISVPIFLFQNLTRVFQSDNWNIYSFSSFPSLCWFDCILSTFIVLCFCPCLFQFLIWVF